MISTLLIAVIFSTPLAAIAAASAVAAVPIIIHLLNRKRYVVVPWAAMRFLLAAQKRNIRRLRLEQWLLLGLRVTIGLLLVVGMAAIMPWAEPLWLRIVPGSLKPAEPLGRTHRIIVMDGSFTMAARVSDDGDRFSRAKLQAQTVLDRAAPGDGFSLIVLTSSAQVVVPGPVDDRRKVAEEIDELVLAHGGSDTAAGLRLVAEMAGKPLGKYGRREVIFITDLKRSGWSMAPASGDLTPASGSLAEIGRSADLVFLDVARQDIDNLSITSVTLGESLPLVDASTSVTAVVQNHGIRDLTDRVVELRIGQAPQPGDKLIMRTIAQKIVTVKAGAALPVTFSIENPNRFREAGEYLIQVRVGEDSLNLDNVRALAIRVRKTIPVLIVDGSSAAEPLDTPGEWIRQALRPMRADGQPVPSPILPTLIGMNEFADPFRTDLSKYDCVFLCDLPTFGSRDVERLEAYLRRGGNIVISLGPNSVLHRDEYNRLLYANGKGILPGKIVGAKQPVDTEYFTLFADEESFKRPPLSAYRDDRERGALGLPSFHRYAQLELSPAVAARRIFSYSSSNANSAKGSSASDPAVLELARSRGRVIVYTNTFNPERIGRGQFWSSWPPHPTFLPFWHESLKFLVADGGRKEITPGDLLDGYLPISSTGLKARLIHGESGSEEIIETADALSRDDAAVAVFTKTERSGLYRVSATARPDSLFAINVPTVSSTGRPESDLRRLSLDDLQAAAPGADLQVVTDAEAIRAPRSRDAALAVDSMDRLEPQGSFVARIVLFAALGLILLEVVVAWRLGSARASSIAMTQSPPTRRPIVVTLLWLTPILAGALILGTWAHAMITDDLLGYLPPTWRQALEHELEVPQASAGEGTRWRLKSLAYITGSWKTDRWIVGVLAVLALACVGLIYRQERIGVTLSHARRRWRHPLLAPAILRGQLLLITLFILLPQLQLLFEREAWPDVVIIFDDSKSMASVELFSDPVLLEKSEELKAAWAELARPRIEQASKQAQELRARLRAQPSAAAAARMRDEIALLEKRIADWRTPHRLNLVKALLASGSKDWLHTLLEERKLRIHLYRASAEATRIAELGDPDQCARMLDEIINIVPEGESSRPGDALAAVLKAFRGRSLSAMVLFSDGQTTHGEPLSQAAVLAKRKKVPLYFVGVGDGAPRPDIAVGDLRAERDINVKDRLIFNARVTAHGKGLPELVPLTLYELIDGLRVRRDGLTVAPSDKPIRLTYAPETPGDKQFVIEVPVQQGETDVRNNRIEHDVHVSEQKRVRVLLIEELPRYEFRFIKSLFERQSEQIPSNKTVDLSVLLTGASGDYYKQDKSALAEFPNWDSLRTYDVIILGDVNPKLLPRPQQQIKMLADFVTERGGGLLLLAGTSHNPFSFAGTELADVLPITTDGLTPPAIPKIYDPPIVTAYRPTLTSTGINHPIFRFTTDDTENAAIWNHLPPLRWYATGYRRKLSAEVLAIHPDHPSEGGLAKSEAHPLILQQFVGNGRVMFFGFDETWLWRFRQDEIRFNQFWMQTIRSLARSRIGRVEVSVPAKTFRRDEPIRITVRFPDDAPPPSPKEPVVVNVERRPISKVGQPVGEPEVQKVPLTLKENTRATYEALLTRTSEGDYRFLLAAPGTPGRVPKTEATVLPPIGELEDTRLNDSDMRRAAAESGGEYFTVDHAADLLERIPDSPRVALDQPCPPLPLWNLPVLFGVLVMMMLAEWLLRKRARLL